MGRPWRVAVGKSTYRRLSAQLAGFFERRLTTNIDPNELVTDVWISAGRYYAKRASLRHYLFVIARSVLVEHERQQRRELPTVSLHERERPTGPADAAHSTSALRLPDEGPGQETLHLLRSRHALVRAAAQELRDPYRQVVQLWLAGLDSVQIASALNLQYNTVRSRLSRGRALLERRLRVRLRLA